MNSVKFVPGEGVPYSKIAFVGEGPGEEEDIQGRPFVGRAGKVLDRWINYLGFQRDEIYITNVVKVRPENNRTPTFTEIESWTPLLWEELKKIHPIVIIPVGASATKAFFRKDFKNFAPNRGKFTLLNQYAIFPIYHPSYILRSPGAEKLVMEDLDKIKDYLNAYAQASKSW